MAEKAKQVYVNDIYFGTERPVRLLFPPALAEPRAAGKGEPKYEVQIGFEKDHPELLALKKHIASAAREKWGADVDIRNGLNLKFVDGDEEYAYYEKKGKDYSQVKGLTIMKLRSAQPIACFDARQKNAKGLPLEVNDARSMKSLFYPGAWVALKLTAATYDAIITRENPNAKPGVTFYPEELCFVADGERIGGGPAARTGAGFATIQGEITDTNPLDDDIPF